MDSAKLTKAQHRALRALSGDKSAGHLNPSTASKTLRSLHRLGLIDLSAGWSLTPAGRAALQPPEVNHG